MDHIAPVEYNIELDLDMERFRFQGTTKIILEFASPAEEVTLNSLDMAVWSVKWAKDAENTVDCRFIHDPGQEKLIVRPPEPLSGTQTLLITYEGEINNKMAGLYRSLYTFENTRRAIAITQFEESDARRVFPCMDHPAKKAAFAISLVVDKDLKTISNMPVQSEERLDNGKKRVRFHRTPKMSTYLVFIGAGDFDMIQDTGEKPVRVFAPPGMIQYAGLGLDFGRKSLDFCETYFQSPYPLPKMDLIAVPDFAFGAMENWGAITFRENLLLDYPNITSKAARERICEIIAHEMVHQWFGNLVTPSDWKYLWLNESFATYVAYAVVDHYYPEWRAHDQFIAGGITDAMNRDAMHDTTPIEIAGGEHIVINSSTAPIIYSKGGAVLRQIEGYLGRDLFQRGLRRYLDTFAYQCASSNHLWETFEQATEKPVSHIMESWVSQPGFPIVDARRDGNRLILSQNRFAYLPKDFEQIWPIPLTMTLFMKNGEQKTAAVLFDARTSEFPIGSDVAAYKLNPGQTGFYRVQYLDEDNFKQLSAFIREKALSPVDRWGMENDMFALARAGRISVDSYMSFIDLYSDEDAYLPLSGIAGHLFHIFRLSSEPGGEKIAEKGRRLFDHVLDKIGYEPSETDPHGISLLRDRLMYLSVVFGSDSARRFAWDAFQAMMQGRTVHQDIQKSVLQSGAFMGKADACEWLIRQFKTVESEQARMNMLIALGCVQEADLIGRVQKFALDEVPDRNKFVPVSALCSNPAAIPSMWRYFKSELSRLEKLHPLHFERVIESVVPVSVNDARDVKQFMTAYREKNPKMKDVATLALEKLEINRRFKLD